MSADPLDTPDVMRIKTSLWIIAQFARLAEEPMPQPIGDCRYTGLLEGMTRP
jgi:hypothetical protein